MLAKGVGGFNVVYESATRRKGYDILWFTGRVLGEENCRLEVDKLAYYGFGSAQIDADW